MNADHADSLVLFARVFGGRADATEATMTAVDRYGFDVVVGGPERAGGAAARVRRSGGDGGGGAPGHDPISCSGPGTRA